MTSGVCGLQSCCLAARVRQWAAEAAAMCRPWVWLWGVLLPPLTLNFRPCIRTRGCGRRA